MKVYEVTKKPVPAERNPVAAFAQRSGAGIHKDQNKKNKPLRKVKHKKKDFTTEAAFLAPLIPAAVGLIGTVLRFGVPALKWILKWIIRNPGKTGGIWTIFEFGPDIYEFYQNYEYIIKPLAKYGIPALAIAYILKNGVEIWNMLKGKDPETISVDELKKLLREPVAEAYKQKAGDYARHGGAMPKKKKRGPHPLGGKLVG
jgi:hypothetical protein